MTAIASAAESARAPARRPVRWHIAVLLAPAVTIYTLIMVLPLFESLRMSLYAEGEDGVLHFVGLANYVVLLTDERWEGQFWNALANNVWFFVIHMLVQNPIGLVLAALLSMARLPGRGFYRTAMFLPTMLSFVIVGFVWKLILSPL